MGGPEKRGSFRRAAEDTQITSSFNTDPADPEDPDAFELVGRTLASDTWISPPYDA